MYCSPIVDGRCIIKSTTYRPVRHILATIGKCSLRLDDKQSAAIIIYHVNQIPEPEAWRCITCQASELQHLH